MDLNGLVLLAVFVIGLVSLVGFFVTKTTGFGRFATSTFLLLLVVVVSAILFAAGKLDAHIMANIFFAVIGFAGGLFTGPRSQRNRPRSRNRQTRPLPTAGTDGPGSATEPTTYEDRGRK